MDFYVSYTITEEFDFPCVQLSTDNWNDYGYRTTFHATYYDENGASLNLGVIKILTRGNDNFQTVLEGKFQKLNDNFCSLGQTMEYYKILNSLPHGFEVLESLRDVILNEDIYDEFKVFEGFEASLLRDSEARLVIKEGANLLETGEITYPEIGRFFFSCKLEDAINEHQVLIDFQKDEYLPYRINAFIGKNGTGKTEVLGRIANTISRANETREEEGKFKVLNGNKDMIEFSGPLFSRVITVSMSSFDAFTKVVSTKHTSYKYCGIMDNNGNLNLQMANQRLLSSYRDIELRGRQEEWREILSKTIDNHTIENFERYLSSNGEHNHKLSSGQTMILSVVTNIISFIKPNTLILFDEPELYLHPNAISGLINMLYEILDNYNSYAILATHSAVILQEIPSKYVKVFKRRENMVNIEPLSIECFGENLTVITNEVFGIQEDRFVYKDILENFSKSLSYEEVNKLFDDELSFNARIHLKNSYNKPGNKGD